MIAPKRMIPRTCTYVFAVSLEVLGGMKPHVRPCINPRLIFETILYFPKAKSDCMKGKRSKPAIVQSTIAGFIYRVNAPSVWASMRETA